MRLKNHIQILQGFQNSVNIAYDLHNDEKVRGFINTRASLEVIEDVMFSTADKSSDRARILIGAYGKGKSHIILVLLAILKNQDANLLNHLLSNIKRQNTDLYNFVSDYMSSKKSLLPVVVSGSSTSLTQSFLGAMQKALEDSNLQDLMPDTHFQAAMNMLKKWETEYVETYKKFLNAIDEPIYDYKENLSLYDVGAYEKFVDIYPTLTSGSVFNPFVGFDVVEIYEKITDKLVERGYSGIYVVYDEFSKYLESSITKASVSDIKMLQDFAEKCNRSSSKQMHLLLISHKDISNYIDKLPKNKVDGWRGVSERFKHVELHNNFSQIYEIISAVIRRDKEFFDEFFKTYDEKFKELKETFKESTLFNDLDASQLDTVIYNCYPLHPLSTFILPRLSEKIAQNERTLFTFLSSENRNTLSAFINSDNGDLPMLTPDLIYDYFEPLFKKEPYISETHEIYSVATSILGRLKAESLEAKIIKTIALIYIVGQFEKLPPIANVIVNAYKEQVDNDSEISNTLLELQDKQYVIYIKKSNGFLKLKKRYDGDIQAEIKNLSDKNKRIYNIKQILESSAADSYIYPTRYNDEFEITRFFDFEFITSHDFFEVENWSKKITTCTGTGVLYGIIPSSEENINEIQQYIRRIRNIVPQIVFVCPRKYIDIFDVAFDYQAAKEIRDDAGENDALIEECNIYIEDYEEIITKYIHSFTKPETKEATYFQLREQKPIYRKAQLSQLLSEICENIYINTPVINNEAINKDFVPAVAVNSRNKVVSALLSKELEPNLGFSGKGQETSIMRSTLVNTAIIININDSPQIDLSAGGDVKLQLVLNTIVNFIKTSVNESGGCFITLYDQLTLPENGIGLKRGVIPIYLAVVLHMYKEYCVVLKNKNEYVITPDLLNTINEDPEDFYIYLENWSDEKNQYIKALEQAFEEQIIQREKEYNTFAYIVKAMNRWFISKPKYAKQIKTIYKDGEFIPLDKGDIRFINTIKSSELNAREFLFGKIAEIYGNETFTLDLISEIKKTKALIDTCKEQLIFSLSKNIKSIFNPGASERESLYSIIRDWIEKLEEKTAHHLFDDVNPYVLEIMKNIQPDETIFIEKLAKAMTGLRIDDWDDENILSFLLELKNLKKTIEDYNNDNVGKSLSASIDMIKVSLVKSDGIEQTKTFNKVEYSSRAKLLKNEIETAIEEMGQSITAAEKRQVLIELLEHLC